MSNHLQVTLAPPEALRWLRRGPAAQVLHVFGGNINLIDQNGAILSLVQPKIGPGPFSAVVERQARLNCDMALLGIGGFTKSVDVHSIVQVRETTLEVGDLSVKFAYAISWDPEPAWHQIEFSELAQAINIIEQSITDNVVVENGIFYPNEGQLSGFHDSMVEAWALLSAGLRQQDSILCREGAGSLAGLGSGFTPAGDDFLIGVIYALYSAARGRLAHGLATVIAEEAMPKTTRLSAAWLRAAMRGEATEAWHALVTALVSKDPRNLVAPSHRIKEIGHSSGVAALAGFVNGLNVLINTA